MTPIRVEWLRLVRTRRWVALLAPFLLFGLTSPLLVRYQQQLVERFATGVTITFPDPTPALALEQYEANVAQLGMIVVVILAAMALAVDANRQRAIFLRSRAASMSRIIAVRATVIAVAASAAWCLGSLGAWYETLVLIAAPDPGRALAGIAFGMLVPVGVVGIVVGASGLLRGATAIAAASLVVLFTLPLLDLIEPLKAWSPVRLQTAWSALEDGRTTARALWKPALSTMASSALLAAFGMRRVARREP